MPSQAVTCEGSNTPKNESSEYCGNTADDVSKMAQEVFPVNKQRLVERPKWLARMRAAVVDSLLCLGFPKRET